MVDGCASLAPPGAPAGLTAATARRRHLAAGLALGLLLGGHAAAQPLRRLPESSLRGELRMLNAVEGLFNGLPVRLSPGVLIRDPQGFGVLSGRLVGRLEVVNLTVEATSGTVNQVWLLRPEELARAWPRSVDEARRGRFEPLSQTWILP